MRGRLFFAVAAVLAAGACATAGADSGSSASATTSSTQAQRQATVVKVSLENFKFVGIPAVIDGPTVRFDAVNRGSVEHELELLDADGEALGEIEAMKPGKKGTMTIDLPEGQYTAQCILEEGGKTHKELGMVQDFEVS